MAQLYLPFPHCHTGMAKNYAEYAFGLLVGQFVSDRYRLIQLKSPRFFTVDGKMMRRSGLLRCAARVRHQHMGLLRSE